MYKPGGTIKNLMDKVAKKEYILPAIQREFVWKPEQICQLFDSLLRGYPFGTFLFWKIEPNNQGQCQFYDFVQDYHERDKPHCERITELHKQEFVAVLDGQQRITALNIGLRGSYSPKLHGKRWANDDSFPERKLYLNLLGKPEDESGTEYQFDFRIEPQGTKRDDNELWFRVSRVMEEDISDLITVHLDDFDLNKDDLKKARDMVLLLQKTIHDKDIISYYEEDGQDLEKVLNIFIRMNSGGTPLSYSDLLLSIAVTQRPSLDAREEIHSLVDEMNQIGYGFNFSKDIVLKAGLMLSDIGSVGFKVENFNKANMEKLEKNWESIRSAMMLATKLLATFGFNSQNLRTGSVILPVAYYLYYRTLDEKYLTSSSEYSEDRSNLQCWLVRSLLKVGIWGSGLDTLLTGLRKVIVDHGQVSYPTEEIETFMARRGKSLRFEDEEIEELSELEYGGQRTFAMLSVLFPGPDFSYEFNVDHIFPKSRFTKSKLGKLGFSDEKIKELMDKSNRLPNLQLLLGSINNEKGQKMPHEWVVSQCSDAADRKDYLQKQAIDELPESLTGYETFYENRMLNLQARIKQVLNG